MRPLRNTGRTMVMSGRCPVPSHGSLVPRTSPGCHVEAGNRSSAACIVRGSVPTNDGMLRCDWLTEPPWLSSRTTPKSNASRMMGENAVRINVTSASSMTA